MKLVIIIPSSPVFIGTLLENLGVLSDSVLELRLSGKMVRLIVCDTLSPYPIEEILHTAEEKKAMQKASGILCISGEGDLEKILEKARDVGYETYILYPRNRRKPIYGSALSVILPYEDFRKLAEKLGRVFL